MKFTNGYWLVREGMRAQHPVSVQDIQIDYDRLTVYAATREISGRQDTLNGALLTVTLSSPSAGIIRVRIAHFLGGQARGPSFELDGRREPTGRPSPSEADPPPSGTEPHAETRSEENDAVLRSGPLEVRIPKGGEWRMAFCGEGRRLTSSGFRGIGYVESEQGQSYVHEGLSLGVGEQVYGLGERFTAFVKNGQSVDIWNQDGGTGSEQAYKNIPFYLTNRGYGIFVDHTERVSFEIGSEKVSKVQFSVPGEILEYLIIYGPEPKDVLRRYTSMTGRPALPPAWSFGLWLSTSFTTSYDEKTVSGFIDGMRERGIPLSVFHFDCFWMREYHWCDFEWDPATFPDPPGMLARLAERGLRISVWINPYIAQRSALFEEGRKAGYLLRRPNGDVWQTDLWQAGMAVVDFTNPEARDWYRGKLALLLDMGVDCFKTDFGERIPTDVVYADGSDPQKMHNYYSYLYNRTVFELLEEKRGRGEAVLFARSATAGGQRFPVHWGGDCESTFVSMADSLRGGLSLGLCGFGFWSHDIGGFEGRPEPAVFKRWIAFGLLSSHSRLHGSSSYRVPWLFDEESVDVLRHFTELKCSLMPYLFACAHEASDSGIPMARAMLLEFPEDPTCSFLDRQYMLGPSLLVAPVFSEEGDVELYLPEGRWTDYASGASYEGGRWMRERHGFLSLPLLVRPGTLLAVGARSDRPDYDFLTGTTIETYGLDEGASVACRLFPGISEEGQTIVEARRSGEVVEVEKHGRLEGWRVLLVGIGGVESPQGCRWERNERGAVLIPTPGAERISARIVG